MLWHITCHYQCFQEKTPAIPELFKTFKDRNDFKAKQKKKNAKTLLFSKDLGSMIDLLSRRIASKLCHVKALSLPARTPDVSFLN